MILKTGLTTILKLIIIPNVNFFFVFDKLPNIINMFL
jgi:hypothetical protein